MIFALFLLTVLNCIISFVFILFYFLKPAKEQLLVKGKIYQAHSSDAGYDIYSPKDFILRPNYPYKLEVDLKTLIPNGYFGLILPRSSISNLGVNILTGVIDAGYTGNLKIVLINNSYDYIKFKKDERIAQIVFIPLANLKILNANTFPKTERGDNGFGSSGK